MERKSLSNSMIFHKILTGVILLVSPFLFINKLNDWWLFIIVAIIYLQVFLFVIYLPDTIEFDREYMYLKRINGEIPIDLGSIYKIKMTGLRLNRRYMWKIKYQINGINKGARFYPDYSFTNIDEFVEYIKLKNPNLEVIYTSGPLDFDL